MDVFVYPPLSYNLVELIKQVNLFMFVSFGLSIKLQ